MEGLGSKSIQSSALSSSYPLLVRDTLVFPLPLGDGSLHHLEGLKVKKSNQEMGKEILGAANLKIQVLGFLESPPS